VAGVIAGVDSTPAASLEGVSLTLSYYSGTYSSAAQLAGLTPLAGAPTDAGAYTVLASFAGGADYTSATALANFSVSPAPLTVGANSSLMLLGNSPPPLTGSVNGTPFTGTIVYTTTYGDQVTVTLGTPATSASPVGQYAITASLSGARAGNYFIDPASSTTGTMYVVSLGPDPSSTTGALALTFWDNKGNKSLITAADLQSLVALNLVNNDGSAFDPNAFAQLQSWLEKVNSPSVTNEAYLLSVQLTVLDLNVLAEYVQPTDLVYAGGLLPYAGASGLTGLTAGGFIDVQDLLNAANAELALDPNAASGNPTQAAYEAALVQVLQSVNGNSDFVQQELLWNLLALYPLLPPAA
jgi:hypothetical protein